MSLHIGAKSQVNIAGRPLEEFEINVGLHQGTPFYPGERGGNQNL